MAFEVCVLRRMRPLNWDTAYITTDSLWLMHRAAILNSEVRVVALPQSFPVTTLT